MSGENLFLGVTVGLLGAAVFGRDVSRLGQSLDELKRKADSSKAVKTTVGGVLQLNRELKAMERAGLGATSAAERLRAKLDQQTKTLRMAGLNTRDLAGEYRRLGEAIKGAELYSRGRDRIGRAMVDAGKFAAVVGTLSKPVRVSAEYSAIVRDIAIKAGVARTPQEATMSDRIITSARDNGMGRNDLAAAINEMVAGGMDLNRALSFAPLAAKFSVGQAATGDETAKMMRSLETNAKITDPAMMRQAMEAIAYAGKAGSFESVDMARWFPELLAEMQKLGITGMDSVTQLAAMLQVQAKTAGSSDQAANNLKNWFSKIGSTETVKRYDSAGINYEKQMQAKIARGKSPLEASFELAREYIEKSDPAKAKAMASAAEQLSKVSDPAKAKAMAEAFAETMKTGDLFADMQVKAALTAYMQNRDLYDRIKREALEAAKAGKQVDKDLAARRAESKKIWDEFGQSWDGLMVKMGAALAPMTDQVGQFGKDAMNAVTKFAEDHPNLSTGAATLGVAGAAYLAGKATIGMIRGAVNLVRGANMLRGKGGLLDVVDKLAGGKGPAGGGKGGLGGALGALAGGVQEVFVVNMPGAGFGGLDLPGGNKPGQAPAGKKAGLLGRAWDSTKKAGAWVTKNPVKAGGALAAAGAAYQAVDTAINAKTAEEKGRGYGGAAGSLAGGIAGAKAGALIGTVIAPGLGTTVGGVVGGVVGGLAGNAAGEAAGAAIARPATAPVAPKTYTPRLLQPVRTPTQVKTGAVAIPGKAAAPVKAPSKPNQAPGRQAPASQTAKAQIAGGGITVHINGAGLTVDQVKTVLVRELDAWWRRQQAAAKASTRAGLHDGAHAGAR